MRISDWSSDVCSSDLHGRVQRPDDALCRARTQQPGILCAGQLHARRRSVERGGAEIFHPRRAGIGHPAVRRRSEEHTSELQSLMRISYAVFCLKKKTSNNVSIVCVPFYTTLKK